MFAHQAVCSVQKEHVTLLHLHQVQGQIQRLTQHQPHQQAVREEGTGTEAAACAQQDIRGTALHVSLAQTLLTQPQHHHAVEAGTGMARPAFAPQGIRGVARIAFQIVPFLPQPELLPQPVTHRVEVLRIPATGRFVMIVTAATTIPKEHALTEMEHIQITVTEEQ